MARSRQEIQRARYQVTMLWSWQIQEMFHTISNTANSESMIKCSTLRTTCACSNGSALWFLLDVYHCDAKSTLSSWSS